MDSIGLKCRNGKALKTKNNVLWCENNGGQFMLRCGLCGKEFEDSMFKEYAAHVQECAKRREAEERQKELVKMNEELEEVKRAKVVYEGLRDAFKEKYPEAYAVNFGKECKEETFMDSSSPNKEEYPKSPSRGMNLYDLLIDHPYARYNFDSYFTDPKRW